MSEPSRRRPLRAPEGIVRSATVGALDLDSPLDLEFAPGTTVAGVDEAGRGPWAGPVVAAAVVFAETAEIPAGLNDSKKLSRRKREALFEAIMATAQVGVGEASVQEIDRDNILNASMLAMRRAVAALDARPDTALVDGKQVPELPCPAHPIVGGDGLSPSIAAASIIAKVTRDRIMTELAQIHADYGWERNFGYGTKEHLAALKAHGVTLHHRRSFAPVRALLTPEGG